MRAARTPVSLDPSAYAMAYPVRGAHPVTRPAYQRPSPLQLPVTAEPVRIVHRVVVEAARRKIGCMSVLVSPSAYRML